MVDVIAETKVLSAKKMRALDSTVFEDAVARQDTVTQLISQIRRVGKVVDGADGLIATLCTRYPQFTGQDYSQVRKPQIAWDDPQAQNELVTALVNGALALLDALDDDDVERDEKQQQAIALLALVAGQDVEPDDDGNQSQGRWRIARKVAKDRVISTVDPHTRHVHKTRKRQIDGYKAHVVVEPDTGLTTQVTMTKGAGEESTDSAAGAVLINQDTTVDPTITDGSMMVLGDAGYAAGSKLHTLRTRGLMPVIKPGPVPRAVDGGLSIDDFYHDDDKGTLSCPAGHTKNISAAGYVTFGTLCQSCTLRPRCTTSPSGRSMKVHEHDILLRQQRWACGMDWFQQIYRTHRPMVERSIAWLARGVRRLRYIGTVKNDAWLHLRATALNLNRLLTLGLTRTQTGGWALNP